MTECVTLRDHLTALGLRLDKRAYVELAETGTSMHGTEWLVSNRHPLGKFTIDAKGTFLHGWVHGVNGKRWARSSNDFVELIKEMTE